MQVQILGCSGAVSQACYTSAFLVDDSVLLDTGSGVGTLTVEAMLRIEHVFLTHAHFDHIAALPLFLDAVLLPRLQTGAAPIAVYALPATIAVLQQHIFNGAIWPDFTRLPSVDRPVLRFVPVQVGDVIQLDNAQGHVLEVLPAQHSVPAVAYAVRQRQQAGALVYTGDTGLNPALWQRLAELEVAGLIIEAAFSDAQEDLAQIAQHLTPKTLLQSLQCMVWGDKGFPIYITHMKPAQAQEITQQIRAHLQAQQGGAPAWAAAIEFLQAGQRLELGGQ